MNLLPSAIESVLKRDYDNLEILIIDNASSDKTAQVVKTYLSDQRVRYIRKQANLACFSNVQRAQL